MLPEALNKNQPAPNPELLRALGRLVRGLSALFWGLPLTLLVCFHTARSDTNKQLGVIPVVFCCVWLLYGLWQVGAFQKRERIWRVALDRSRILAFAMLGLSPFLFWWNRIPGNLFFLTMVVLMALTGVMFLMSLNLVLQRLGAMLPDEALRMEISQFTALNLNLLLAMVVISGLTVLLMTIPGRNFPYWLYVLRMILDRASLWFMIPLLLLPLAMTMALIWKTKEVILDSVFNRHPSNDLSH